VQVEMDKIRVRHRCNLTSPNQTPQEQRGKVIRRKFAGRILILTFGIEVRRAFGKRRRA
jgi:hypothetical protein